MLILELLSQYYLQGLLSFGFALLGMVSYRLLFHPLASYPGPLLARITDLYGGVLSMRMKLPLVITDLHEKQGSVIRLGPNRLHFNTSTAFQEIYRDDRRITKAWTYELISRNRIFNVFNTLDRDVHRAKRRIISSALSKRAIESFEPALIGQIDAFLEILRQAADEGSEVNMTERMSYLATDVIGLMALGHDLGTQTRDENRHVPRSLFFNLFMLNIGNHLPSFSYLYQNRIFDFVMYRAREKFARLLEDMVQRRLSLDTHALPDLFSFVAEAMPKYFEKTRGGAIWKESIVFMTAGGDTVASGLTGIFFYLSRYPACYEKAAKEVRSKFEDAGSIKDGGVLQSCQYLRACIDESLRMSPPISATLWRQQVEADKAPLSIDGHHIPRGTFFGVNIYALSHNPDIFPDPHTYNPDRWLTDDPALPKMKENFASFGIGPRDCAGRRLAYLELMLVAAKTLWQFDFEKASGPIGAVGDGLDRGRPNEFQIHDGFNSTHAGPCLVFRPRV